MKQRNSLTNPALIAATLLAAAALNTHAQGWETYPQGDFTPRDIAAEPIGTVAYAVNGGLAIRRGDLVGTSWNTLTPPSSAIRLDDVTVSASGRVYVSGMTQLPDGKNYFRVWFSDDLGVNWFETATFLVWGQGVGDIATDAAGNIYIATSRVVGAATIEIRHLTTYKGVPDLSAPTGIAWTQVDDYPPTGKYVFSPDSVAAKPSTDGSQPSEIWVASNVMDSRNLSMLAPVLRHSTDSGATWSSAAAWLVPRGYSSPSVGSVTVDRNGKVFVSANYSKKVGKASEPHGLIYHSTNGGASWTLVDDVTGYSYGPNGGASDAFNGIFFTGAGLTRASVDGGDSWVTVTPVAGGSCVAADLVGNVFAGGNVTSGSTTDGYIYKLPAPAP